MRSLAWVLLLVAGCVVRNAETCDRTHDCVSSSQQCDLLRGRCVSKAFDLSVPDLRGADLAVVDTDGGGDGGGGDAGDAGPMCALHGECAVATPLCQPVGSCRACASAADDLLCQMRDQAKARCQLAGSRTGQCAECRPASATTDCMTSTMPICDDGVCRACSGPADCATGICKPNGACAADGEVAFVDNGGIPATCNATGTHDGGPTTPFCDIQDGVILTAKPYVKVTGRGSALYGKVVITSSRTVTIVGAGAQPVILRSGDNLNANLDINLASGSATVVVENLEIGDRTFTNTLDGVYCNAAGSATVSLTIRRSVIQRATQIGLNAVKCTVVLDQNVVKDNSIGGAIFLGDGTNYTITNNFIYKNTSTTQAALRFGDASTGIFQFNTVTANTRTGGAAGANCGLGAAKILEASIFYNNTPSEFVGNCVAFYVHTDDGTVGAQPTNQMGLPGFMNAGSDDYRITGNACVDKVTMTVDGGAAMRSDHDFFGTRRPLGVAHDIGAHEAR